LIFGYSTKIKAYVNPAKSVFILYNYGAHFVGLTFFMLQQILFSGDLNSLTELDVNISIG